MSSQTSLVARQVRLRQWADQIRECNNRPEGMSVDVWCAQQGITKANYYYRVKQVRQACIDVAKEQAPEVFVEIPSFPPVTSAREPSHVGVPGHVAAVLRGTNGMSLEVFSDASASFVQALIEAMAYAK